MNNSRLHRIKVPSGKTSGDILYKPELNARLRGSQLAHRVFPITEDNLNKSLDSKYAIRKSSEDEDEYNDKPYSRAHSQISDIVKDRGIPSPLKWNVKSKRLVRKATNQSESSEYLPSIYEGHEKRSSSTISIGKMPYKRNPLDINDIDGARPQPISYIRKKQQLQNDIKTNSHTLANSGRITPLRMDRSYDSRRYMRVEDLDLKKKPGKVIIPIKEPEGFKEETNMLEYREIPKQQKLLVQQGRLPFTRRYTKEK